MPGVGKSSRKHGRMRRRAGHQKYNQTGRWLVNKLKAIARGCRFNPEEKKRQEGVVREKARSFTPAPING